MEIALISTQGNRMNKGELIESVSAAVDMPKATAGKVIDAVFDTITGSLANGEMVSLIGFGSFSVRERAARTGRNPRTGATLDIPASNAPVFKASKNLKDAVK
jgi:DNA-binding protein HU-beta